jgi:methylmalonyl-CoA mutase C-terminal domain/subunit
MPVRKARILLGRLGEGYKESLLNLAKAFGDAGFEVVYTELQDPEAIVQSAVQESADHIGITILPGATIGAFQEIKDILSREGMDHITVTAGGFLEDKNIPVIKAMGVKEFFPRGTSFEILIRWAKQNIAAKND